MISKSLNGDFSFSNSKQAVNVVKGTNETSFTELYF